MKNLKFTAHTITFLNQELDRLITEGSALLERKKNWIESEIFEKRDPRTLSIYLESRDKDVINFILGHPRLEEVVIRDIEEVLSPYVDVKTGETTNKSYVFGFLSKLRSVKQYFTRMKGKWDRAYIDEVSGFLNSLPGKEIKSWGYAIKQKWDQLVKEQMDRFRRFRNLIEQGLTDMAKENLPVLLG